MIGRIISHYKILEELGAGGMGIVCKAEDLKLKRVVALKFLPAELTLDDAAKSRFIHEAQAASALQHHNICAIHEIDETADRRLFIAMDCYDGETLKQKISRGPLPVGDAIDIAIQVAEGLSEAHSSGMVHRDIKPANIMVTSKGVVKILDFGLAKLAGQTRITRTGTTVGTVAYMSPEQARGEELDSRSDIWSLGITLHEMITCRIAFRGDHEAAVVYGIINGEPEPMTSLRAGVPMELERIVTKCLAKDPSERYQSARGLISDLRPLQKTLASKTSTLPTSAIEGSGPRSKQRTRRSVLRRMVPWLLVPVAILVGWFIRQPGQKALDDAKPPARYEIPLPDGGRLMHYGHEVTLSPDGRQLAFVSSTVDAADRVESQILLRRLDQWQARPIPGTAQSAEPVFSPDGRWIAFAKRVSDDWMLEKVALEGGQPVTLCPCSIPFGACWGTDGRIYFAALSGGIQRVSESGGEPETITELDAKRWEKSHRLPCILPDGDALLFTVVRHRTVLLDWGTAEIWVQPLGTGERKLLIEGGSDARYISTGHIVFARNGNLFAVGFDTERLAVTGKEVPVLEGVRHSVNTGSSSRETGAAQYSVSINGVLAYAPGSVYPKVTSSIVSVDRQGREEPLPIEMNDYLSLRVSPDGRRMLIVPYYPPWDVWSYDFERGTMRRQTFTGNNVGAIWGPGPENFTFSSYRDGAQTFYFKPLDSGPDVAEELVPEVKISEQLVPGCWSPDGETMAFVMFNEETGHDIYIVARGSAPEPFVETEFSENHPEFSPDGRWLSYTSDESSRREVYVRPFPGPGKATQISTGGGSNPAWSRNGEEIFYRNRDAFWATRVEAREGLMHAAEPEELFAANYMHSSPGRSYDVTGDGRFMMVKLPDNESLLAARAEFCTDRIRVIQSWFGELESTAATPR